MKKTITASTFAIAFWILATTASAVERFVPTPEYPTIQSAINAAVNGDTVTIAAGTYYENINFNGKNIVLTSTNPEDPNIAAATIIIGDGRHSVVTFAGTETPDCLLTGFTITGGHSSVGGGVWGNYTYASITHCIVKENVADVQGGGIENSNGLISHCIIAHNSAMIGGGMARCYGTIINCLIARNSASYEAGGIARSESSKIINCTIVANEGNGLNACRNIINCIIWFNPINGCLTPQYSCVQEGDTRLGNINSYPLFVDPAHDDFRLQAGSPCIDSGTNIWPEFLPIRDLAGNFRQADGNNDKIFTVDMGAYEYGTVETPLISVYPLQFEFGCTAGGPNPSPKTVYVWNFGNDILNWQLTGQSSWLQVSPTSGTSGGEINQISLTVDNTGLSVGTYTCDLTIYDAAAANGPVTISVTLAISPECQNSLCVPAYFSTIQEAIDAAKDGDTVIVAPGTYTGTGNRDIDFKGKKITVRGTEPNDPIIVAATIIDCNGTWDEPHSGFYFHSGEGASSVLSGLTITNGWANIGWWPQPTGWGVDCQESSPTITRCIFKGNSNDCRGAGIYCSKGNPVISNCTITGISSRSDSVGIWLENSNYTITGCTINANSYDHGSAVYCYDSNLTIENSAITNNFSLCGLADGFYNGGGGIHSEGSNLTITDCNISGNSCPYGLGSGIYSSSSGIYSPGGSLTITKSTINNNSSEWDGGICCFDCNTIITDCTFTGNPDGAVFCDYGSSLTISNCTFNNNYGGGIGISEGRLTVTDCNISNGSGIHCSESISTISNCTIKNNKSIEGGGIGCRGGDCTITNCIISYNSATTNRPDLPYGLGGGIYCSAGSIKISNSIINNNTSDFDGGGIYCRGGNAAIINCIICSNLASDRRYHGYGGGISCSGATIKNCVISNNSALMLGGGIYCSNSTISNCSITGNSAQDGGSSDGAGGGIYCSGNGSIINSIIWDNYYDQIVSNSVMYCDIQDGWPGKGNIDTDPLLTQDGHLQKDSPCINTGDPNYSPPPEEVDIDGEARITASRVDIGADEFLDSDSDGLPDFWEVKYFGNITTANPDDDPDGDGYANLAEYAHSTEPNAAPADYYVNPQTGDDTYDGLAPVWDGLHGPKKTIQAAVNACAVNRNDTVILAQDTYTGDGNRDVDFCGKIITIRSTDPQEPNIVAETIIDCQGTAASPHRGFVLHSGEGSASIIAGLTITNGYGPLLQKSRYSSAISVGGAIFCDNTSPTIRNCVISNNIAYSGGGIYCRGGSPIITDCSISGNLAKRDYSYAGAGIYCEYSSPNIINCFINKNSTSASGGGIYCRVGNLVITNCSISRNSARSGGGIWCEYSHTTISNCKISDNSANGPAGIYSNMVGGIGSLTVVNCTISGNRSQWSGGGIAFYYGKDLSPVKIINCKIIGNSAKNRGGGINSAMCNYVIANCTFAGNSAPYGNALAYSIGCCQPYPPYFRVTNSIFRDGGNEIWQEGDPKIDITYSNIQGGCIGEGNVDADPCFVQPGFWADPNNTPTDPNDDVWTDGDYHLCHGSLCINTGDPNYTAEPNETDLDDKPRIIGGRIDMGAYEFNHIPIANAGSDQTVYACIDGFADVTLDGSASYDEDNQPLSYKWIWHGGIRRICSASGVSPTIKLPVGQHRITLVVNDGVEYSKPDEVIITVIEPLKSQLSITPQTINRQSQQPQVTAVLQLPAGVTRSQIDNSEPLLLYPGGIKASRRYIYRYSGRAGAEHTVIIAFFDKDEMMGTVPDNGDVQVQVVGKLKSGRYFYGVDTVRILALPHRR